MKAYENQLREQEKEKGAKKMMRKIMSPLTVFSSVMSTSVFAGAIGEMVFALRYFLRRTWFLSLLAAPM